MRLDHKGIVEKYSEGSDFSQEELQAMSNHIFGMVRDWSKDPDCLGVSICKFGTFYYSKKKTLNLLKKYESEEFMAAAKKSHYYDEEAYEKMLNDYRFILKEYEKFIADKASYKNKSKDEDNKE